MANTSFLYSKYKIGTHQIQGEGDRELWYLRVNGKAGRAFLWKG
jgi:hypothetical protein